MNQHKLRPLLFLGLLVSVGLALPTPACGRDGTLQKEFLTRPLWGVGSKVAYGHDGRSINLTEVILRHGQEAQGARIAFAELESPKQRAILEFLRSLVLFPPDDTASNLDPGDRGAQDFPQFGHGSIKLTVLFNDPTDKE